jgi:hypothetical protein
LISVVVVVVMVIVNNHHVAIIVERYIELNIEYNKYNVINFL